MTTQAGIVGWTAPRRLMTSAGHGRWGFGSISADGWIVMSGSQETRVGGDEPGLEFGSLSRNEPFVLFFPGACELESDENEDLPLGRR